MKFALVLVLAAVCAISAEEAEPFAQLLRQEDIRGEGAYQNSYETDAGTSVFEEGHLVDGPEGAVYAKSGYFRWVGPDGETYIINWTADADGYKAAGEHLPVAPQ